MRGESICLDCKQPASLLRSASGRIGWCHKSLADFVRCPGRLPPAIRAVIPYEIPLRPGVTARLVLPVDLTETEADRLCAVIISLAFGELSSATIPKRQG